MNVLISGGSGFLGRALSEALRRENGAKITWLTRGGAVPGGVSGLTYAQLPHCTEYFDVVVNLAGAGIADRCWSARRKAALLASRLQPTQALLDWTAAAPHKPALWLNGSAIGWYGAQAPDMRLNENAAPHHDFAHELCAQWEALAFQAAQIGVNVAVLRTGVVLDGNGGMLQKMRLPFRLGMGCVLGSGRQMVSWISRRDWVRAVQFIINQEDTQRAAVYNLTAPQAASHAELVAALAQSLHRRVRFRLPESLLRMAFGEMATLLADGQNVVPQALLSAGFAFQDTDLLQAVQSRAPEVR